MTARSSRPALSRRQLLVAGLGAVLAACAGDGGGPETAAAPAEPTGADPSPSPSPSPSASTDPSPAPSTEGSEEPVGIETPDYPTGIVPASIVIPAIEVDAPVVELQLTATEAEVPQDFDDAGWWVQTRKPGEIGPAVVGGHVDSTSGPAVFFRLDELAVGDEVTVADADGETRSFVVSETPIRVRKDQRPPEVFGFGEGRPELRLITCGGDFDPNTGHYVDNVVVFCHDETFEGL